QSVLTHGVPSLTSYESSSHDADVYPVDFAETLSEGSEGYTASAPKDLAESSIGHYKQNGQFSLYGNINHDSDYGLDANLLSAGKLLGKGFLTKGSKYETVTAFQKGGVYGPNGYKKRHHDFNTQGFVKNFLSKEIDSKFKLDGNLKSQGNLNIYGESSVVGKLEKVNGLNSNGDLRKYRQYGGLANDNSYNLLENSDNHGDDYYTHGLVNSFDGNEWGNKFRHKNHIHPHGNIHAYGGSRVVGKYGRIGGFDSDGDSNKFGQYGSYTGVVGDNPYELPGSSESLVSGYNVRDNVNEFGGTKKLRLKSKLKPYGNIYVYGDSSVVGKFGRTGDFNSDGGLNKFEQHGSSTGVGVVGNSHSLVKGSDIIANDYNSHEFTNNLVGKGTKNIVHLKSSPNSKGSNNILVDSSSIRNFNEVSGFTHNAKPKKYRHHVGSTGITDYNSRKLVKNAKGLGSDVEFAQHTHVDTFGDVDSTN
ncbi:trematode Eggshell Synthesis, partial [Opisthorchis viverrini]